MSDRTQSPSSGDEELSLDRIERAWAAAIKFNHEAPGIEWAIKRLDEKFRALLAREIAEQDSGEADGIRSEISSSLPEAKARSSELLTTGQAAQLLGVPPETLRMLRRTRRGPKYTKRIVKWVMPVYARKDLEEWIEKTQRSDVSLPVDGIQVRRRGRMRSVRSAASRP